MYLFKSLIQKKKALVYTPATCIRRQAPHCPWIFSTDSRIGWWAFATAVPLRRIAMELGEKHREF